MNNGERYDRMLNDVKEDKLGLFEHYDMTMRIVQASIHASNPKRIVDIGCGTGNLSGPLSKEFKVVGVDVSAEMLSHAQLKYPEMNVLEMNLEQPLDGLHHQIGDLIVSSFVFHGIKNKRSALEWIADGLARGGEFILADYVFESRNEWLNRIEQLRKNGMHEEAELISSKHYLFHDELREWADAYNLVMVISPISDLLWLIRMFARKG